jgi:ADP-ribosylglycohydrolase
MEAATALGLRTKPSATSRDAMTACYLGQALPSTLDMVCKYTSNDNVWQGLLANANVGGENVHRGSILGAILGARAGEDALPINLKKGLHDYAELEQEIDSFVKAVIKR